MDENSFIRGIIYYPLQLVSEPFELFLFYIQFFMDYSLSNEESIKREIFEWFHDDPAIEMAILVWIRNNCKDFDDIPETLRRIIDYVGVENFSENELFLRFFPESI